MHILRNLILTFNVTEKQKQLFKEFCRDKKECDSTITVAQSINSDYILFLSVLVKEPNIRFGIYSRETGTLIHDIELSDDVISGALDMLDVKYAFNTTRKSPREISELVHAWANYLNDRPIEEIIPIE